jgi:hypothetical protein
MINVKTKIYNLVYKRETMSEIATKTTWKNFPIDKPRRIEFYMNFTDQQFSKLSNGLIPQQMEDKWFIYYENNWLYFHRSWTGLGIFKAQVIKETEGYAIKDFWVETNHDNYKNRDDNAEIANFSFLVTQGLLGIDVREFYTHSETDVVRAWSNFGNMLFGNPKDNTFSITRTNYNNVFLCNVCNEICGEITVQTESSSSENEEKYYLNIDHFSQNGNYKLTKTKLESLVELYTSNQLEKVFSMDREYIPFYCPECNANYCKNHWDRWVTYDEGYYDAEYGICPKGHERKLFD